MAMEADATGADNLGTAASVKWSDLCAFMGPVKHNVEVIDKKNKIVGNIIFKT